MSCRLQRAAAAACGQRIKSQRSSGRSPSLKGGGPNWGRAERLDGSSGPYLTDGHVLKTLRVLYEAAPPSLKQSGDLGCGFESDVCFWAEMGRFLFFTSVNSSYN